MFSLIKWELIKLLKKKRTKFILLFMIFYIIFSNYSLIKEIVYHDTWGREYRGIEAFNIIQEQEQQLFSGELTDSEVKSDLIFFVESYNHSKNISGMNIEAGMSRKDYYGFYKPRIAYFTWIMENYAQGNRIPVLESLEKDDIEKMNDFYEEREVLAGETIESFRKFKLSENEKNYWKDLADQSTGPYKMGYSLPVNMMLNMLMKYDVLIMGIGFCIAGIFSDEYENNIESILLTSKFGRSRLPFSKLLAAFIFSGLALSLFLLAGPGLYFIFGNNGGWDLPIQLIKTNILLPWTFGELITRILILLYLMMIFMIGIVIYISSKSRKTVLPIIASAVIMQGGFLLNIEGGDLVTRIKWLLPDRLLLPNYFHLLSYEVFGQVFDIYTFAMIIYGVMALIILPHCVKGFRNYKISRRREESAFFNKMGN